MEREIINTPLGVIERASEETILELVNLGLLEITEDGIKVAEQESAYV